MVAARRSPKQLQLDGLPTIHPNAAGMDIGAEVIVVAVPPDRDAEPSATSSTDTAITAMGQLQWDARQYSGMRV